MKLPILLAAGAVALAGVAATPAQAQRYGGYDSYRHGDGYRDRGYRGDYRHDGWRHDRGWRGHGYGYGYRDRGHYGRPRVRCRIVRGYYGPERRCFRVY